MEEELKRRSYFKYIYTKLLDFIEKNLIPKEFEQRKKFFDNNCKIGEKSKMEKKTISILNAILDIKQEAIYMKLKEKINENELTSLGSNINKDEPDKKVIVFNEDLLTNFENLKNELNGFFDSLYLKNKKSNIKVISDNKKKLKKL